MTAEEIRQKWGHLKLHEHWEYAAAQAIVELTAQLAELNEQRKEKS